MAISRKEIKNKKTGQNGRSDDAKGKGKVKPNRQKKQVITNDRSFDQKENAKIKQLYKKLIILAVIAYAVLLFYLCHVLVMRHFYPDTAISELLVLGLKDMFTHPFELSPLDIQTVFMIVLLSIVAIALIVMFSYVQRLRRHDDPDTVQGDAKWLKNLSDYNRHFTEPLGTTDHNGTNNMILCEDLYMSLNNKAVNRNMNTFVIGGSGAGKTFNYVAPNLLQANCSFVVTDPSGGLFKEYGRFFEYMGYHVKVFNISHMEKSNHYNPFRYIHSDKDVEVLVTTLISNTTPKEKQGGDPFWEKSETALLVALIAYLFHYASPKMQNFSNVMRLLRAAQINEEDSTSKSKLDYVFEEVEIEHGETFAVKQYKTFKMGAGKTLKSILISCAVRLQAFDLEDVARLTDTDDIDLDSIGDEKTALFIIIPTGEKTFNFLASMMYSQLFQRTYDYCENEASFSQLVLDGDGQLVKTFRAGSEGEVKAARAEAEAFLERAKEGSVVYNPTCKWYEICTKDGELVTWRGQGENERSFKKAKEAFELLKKGKVISNADQSNNGQRLPIHTRMILDEFANIGKIPEFPEKAATIRKYELSTAIICQSLQQLKNIWKDDWEAISGNCDNTIYLGGGADLTTTEWMSKLLGKETRVVLNMSYSHQGGNTSLNRQGVELYTPSQLRTMDEKDCIVLPKSLYAFKGRKYKSVNHPNWELKSSLGDYFYNEIRYADIMQRITHPSAEADISKEHGGVEEETTEERSAREARNRVKEQQAQEFANNEDANQEPIIEAPSPVSTGVAGGSEVEKRLEIKKKEDVKPAAESSWEQTSAAWGADEVLFGEAPADYSPSEMKKN